MNVEYWFLCVVIILSLLFYFLLSKVFVSSNIKFYGKNCSPIGLLTVIQVCVFSMPGILLISFFNFDSWRYDTLSEPLKYEVGIWYFYSIFVMFFIIYIASRLPSSRLSYRSDSKGGVAFSNVLILFSILYLFLIFLKNGTSLPIFSVLSGNILDGYDARIEYQQNSNSFRIAYVSDIMEQVIKFQFMYLIFIKKTTSLKISRLKMLISFFLVFVLLFLDLQKAPILIYLMVVAFFTYSLDGKMIKGVFKFVLIIPLVVVIYLNITEIPNEYIFSAIVDRAFLGQNQGFYHIINSISPNEKYIWQGFPFSSIFSLEQYRADVDVLKYIYNESAYVNMVNTNSYYLGQAWSMFGYAGLIISPVVVGFVVSVFYLLLSYLCKVNSSIFYPLAFLLIPFVQVNQSFTYFLYPKHMILNVLLVGGVLFFMYKLSNLKFRKIN